MSDLFTFYTVLR